jgi:raffinose/stachyose/melibiose transport system substrate-binding protein
MNRFRILSLALTVTLVLAAVGPATAQEVVTVTWWTEAYEDAVMDHIQQTFVDAFNADHPDIQVELLPQENLNDALRPAIQAGAAPDIIQTPGPSYVKEYFDAGFLLPMDMYAEQYGWQDKMLPWAYASGLFEGKLYSVQLTYESMVLIYNKTLFEQNGWEVPTTLEEMEGLATEMADMGVIPFSYGNVGWQPTNEHLEGIYLNNYAGPENVYLALIGEKPWTDPEFVEAVNLLTTHIVDNGWFGGSLENYYSYAWDDFWSILANGEGGMMMVGTWGFRGAVDYFADTDYDWDWAPLPTFSEMAGEYNYELAIGSTLSINGASEHPDAAAAVLDYLFSDKARALEIASGAAFGEWVVPLIYTEEDFPEGTDERLVRFFVDFAEVTGEGRYGYTTWTFWPAKPNVHLWEAIEDVWAGDTSVEDYLAEHQALWDEARAEGKTLEVAPRE